MTTRALLASLAMVAACEREQVQNEEPEEDEGSLYGECSDDDALDDELVNPRSGTNNLVEDGSDPFCTIGCESDDECGDGQCARIIEFGPLACADWNPERDCLTETDANGTPAFSEQRLSYCVP